MPNFHMHWLVAREALSDAPEWIRNGHDVHRDAAHQLSSAIHEEMRELIGLKEDAARKVAKKFGATVTSLQGRIFRGGLRPANPAKPTAEELKRYDDATCFAAYMLGACGPDFWTLPSGGLIVPDFATHHFDLGHYNRTHEQFFVSVRSLAPLPKEQKDALKSRVEMAYFLGMATHFATDLILHELVNVSAGAYNLLDKLWENENGSLTTNLWSTHNKTEHYWDTYVRLRYLGDFGPLFGEADAKNWVTPMDLPCIEGLQQSIPEALPSKVQAELRAQLDGESVRIALEKPLVLPQLYADRLLAGDFPPFVYDRVVDKDNGAYPKKYVPQAVTDEATSSQMKRSGKRTEANKVEFFSSNANTGTGARSHNYLTYIICPDSKQVREFGRDIFYHLDALEPFIQRAATAAKAFVRDLSAAYGAGSTDSLRYLGRFWNLDTGLGIRVVRKKSNTPNEAITRLDFVHVLDRAAGADGSRIAYERKNPDAHVEYADPEHDISKKANLKFDFKFKKPAFKTAPAKPPFPKQITEVTEAADEFLDALRLDPPIETPASKLSIEDATFFAAASATPGPQKGTAVDSASVKASNTAKLSEIAHRLNLEISTAIPGLCSDPATKGEVGMFLYADPKFATQDATIEAKEWLLGKTADAAARVLDYQEDGTDAADGTGLRRFVTRILANLEPKKDLKPAETGWNNVIKYSDHENDYGRNFALTTGRARVLHGIDSGNFDPKHDFAYYENVSPTEQVFFSLHPLVRTPDGVFDVFSKEKVEQSKMDEIRRIQAVGFVKIVLYYELTAAGGYQLGECWVDGLQIRVEDE